MRNKKNKYLVKFQVLTIFIVVVLHVNVSAFNGTPNVNNYPETVHQGSGQSWAATQDAQGIMYFANTSGVLEFDGKRWLLHELPGKRGSRAIRYHAQSHRIYCGSFEEFGYWHRDPYGELHYHSLSDSLSNHKMHNDEIWSIIFTENTVYFRAFATYFTYRKGVMEAATLPYACLELQHINGLLYASTVNGLYVFQNRTPIKLIGGERFTGKYCAMGLMPFDQRTMLIATREQGLYLYNGRSYTPFHTEADHIIQSSEINRAMALNDSVFILGTLLDGVVAVDRGGKMLWHVNKLNGLQNNTVLGLCSDHEGNVWCALDNGIDHIDAGSPLRFYLGTYDNVEAVYAIAKYDNKLYLGTNKGLFCSNGNRFNMVAGTQGQVWDLSVWNGQLLCGHNNGTFSVNRHGINLLSDVTGGYCIRPLPNPDGSPETLIQSTYTSLVLYKKNAQGQWRFSHIIPDFIEPIRYLEIDHLGNIWGAHLEKGFFKIRLNSAQTHIEHITRYDSIGGARAERIGIFKGSNRIIFTTSRELYTYSDISEAIIPFNKLNLQLGALKDAHRIIAAGDNRCWLARDNELALVNINADGQVDILQQIPHSALKDQVNINYECAYNNQGVDYIGLTRGFAMQKFDAAAKFTTKSTSIVLRRAEVLGEEYVTNLETNKQNVQLSAKQNNIKFTFAYPSFATNSVALWHRLDGLEQEWSPANSDFEKEYSRLPSGKYAFMLKALDTDDNILAQTQYNFTIKPAWYATGLAYLVYLLLAAGALAFSYRIWHKQLMRHQDKIMEREEKKRVEELEQKEQKIIRLKNEKLESELLYKGKELAGTTMAIIQKNNVLQELKKELQKEEAAKNIKSIIKLINKNLSSEDDWKLFQSNFDLIHDRFFRNLKKRTPTLTSHDLQLCAYLRLNLSTKEIAQLMGNSVRGVEVARYRLRKKLELPQDINLNEFMIEFKY